MSEPGLKKLAVLDDHGDLALRMADWSVPHDRASITVFNDHIAGVDAIVHRLHPFDVSRGAALDWFRHRLAR